MKIPLILCFSLCHIVHALTDVSFELVKKFVLGKKVASAVAFVCPERTQLQLMKMLGDIRVPATFYHPSQDHTDMDLRLADNSPTALILDLECEGSYKVLKEAARKKYFGVLHHWLIFINQRATSRKGHRTQSVTQENEAVTPAVTQETEAVTQEAEADTEVVTHGIKEVTYTLTHGHEAATHSSTFTTMTSVTMPEINAAMIEAQDISTLRSIPIKRANISAKVLNFQHSKQYYDICAEITYINDTLEPLEFLEAYVDSYVLVAEEYNTKEFLLYEIFKFGPNEPLIKTAPEKWSINNSNLRILTREYSHTYRKDYQGLLINTGMVLVYTESMDVIGDMRYKHLDMWNKMNFEYIRLVAEMLNFRPNILLVRSWGYWRNGTFDGLVGLMQSGEAEIGAVGLAIKKRRWGVLDYAADTTDFKGPRFLFRQPSLSSVTNIFTLPFERTVWFACCGLIAVIAILLYLVLHVENKANKNQDETVQADDSFSDVVLSAIGAICQQGSTIEPQKVSSRIAFLFLFVLAVFLFTAYSACIVSLLQTSSSAIRTLNDLVEGPHKIGIQDTLYNKVYPNETSNELVHGLYKKSKGFISVPEGVELLRKKLFAFHVDVSRAYKLMSEYFQEHEKCGFMELQMYPYTVLGIPVKKRSPYKEHVAQGLRWLKEVGIIAREFRRRVSQKPVCSGSGSGFISVGIVDFYPAILVFVGGTLCSFAMLILEIIWYNRFRHLQDTGMITLVGFNKRIIERTRKRFLRNSSFD